jgi:hypothetical protein
MEFESTQLAAIILGVIAPNLVAVFVQPNWSDQLRLLVSLGVYMVMAGIVVWVDNGFAWSNDPVHDIAHNFGLIAVAGYSSFKLFWQDTQITSKIETATSPAPDLGELPTIVTDAPETPEIEPREPKPPRRL